MKSADSWLGFFDAKKHAGGTPKAVSELVDAVRAELREELLHLRQFRANVVAFRADERAAEIAHRLWDHFEGVFGVDADSVANNITTIAEVVGAFRSELRATRAEVERLKRCQDIVHDNFHDEENCDCVES